MSKKFNFSEWLKEEMTSTGSVGGGGTFTNSIANFARPIFSSPIRKLSKRKKNENTKLNSCVYLNNF